jgi:predicted transcriptional regulator
MEERNPEYSWTFLTNHSHVLLCLAEDSAMRMRDIAQEVRITERAVQRMISDLVDEGYIDIVREGRRNTYKINTGMHLRHPIEREKTIRELIDLI